MTRSSVREYFLGMGGDRGRICGDAAGKMGEIGEREAQIEERDERESSRGESYR